MRAHRRFQPMLDSMPIRIAPSSIERIHASSCANCWSLNTDSPCYGRRYLGPRGGHSAPIILETVSPPTTLPC